MDDFDARVDEKMDRFRKFLAQMDGAKRILIEDALLDYCHIDTQLDDVKAMVRETGTTIINKQGNVVRNPDLMTQHQLVNEKNALLPKILKHIDDGGSGDNDELLSFLGR